MRLEYSVFLIILLIFISAGTGIWYWTHTASYVRDSYLHGYHRDYGRIINMSYYNSTNPNYNSAFLGGAAVSQSPFIQDEYLTVQINDPVVGMQITHISVQCYGFFHVGQNVSIDYNYQETFNEIPLLVAPQGCNPQYSG